MIDTVVEFIRKETRQYLALPDDSVTINSARKLVEDSAASGAIISVVNIEEETALKNAPYISRRIIPDAAPELIKKNPPIFMNVSLLFAFEFQTYAMSLNKLAKTIEFFQQRAIFTPANAPALPAGLDKVTMEMVNMDFEELNHLWGILGGSYFPSVVYKMRVLAIEGSEQAPSARIDTIEINTEGEL